MSIFLNCFVCYGPAKTITNNKLYDVKVYETIHIVYCGCRWK